MNIWCPNVQFYQATQRHRCCNIQFTGYSSTARALVDTPEANVLLAQDLWQVVIKCHILESPFTVISTKDTCAFIMLSTQHLDMPHLSGGLESITSTCEKWEQKQNCFHALLDKVDWWLDRGCLFDQSLHKITQSWGQTKHASPLSPLQLCEFAIIREKYFFSISHLR